MTQLETETAKLAPETRLGAVELTVTDLGRSVPFYQEAIGLKLHRAEDGKAVLGAGGDDDLLVLVEEPEARRAGRHAGLYHFALLHPSRLELARAALRLAATQTPIQGASDHGISEAIYLSDPDGNGIELASDRPKEEWPDLSVMSGGPDPLDLAALQETVATEEPQPVDPALTVGHLHLHVGDLDAAKRFYVDVVGFDVMTYLPSAVFVAAGGYHHHVGFNTWRGPGVPPAPEGTVGLRHFTVVLRDEAELNALLKRARAAGVDVDDTAEGPVLRDPSGNALLFRTA